MPRMTRKQVYIEPRQNRLLKEHARRYRVTEADLIRQAIDRGLERTATRAPDIKAWKRIERFIGRRRSQRVRPAKRTCRPAERPGRPNSDPHERPRLRLRSSGPGEAATTTDRSATP